ncbi:carbonic anhydrase 4-like [Dermacentor silvarum]|uniref:carbonic anhydrase 4-like n=1 Tax=Dermacentor silvarum TaxID=543639 RepID=UPI0021015C19|nr:carbonic anhydrase 4-like [Dermacentor silvarum]
MKRRNGFVLLEHPDWKTRYEACGDAVQSPIHVQYLDSQFRQFKTLYYNGFQNLYDYVVENGVHGVYMTLMDGTVSLYGGPLAVRYNLSRVILRFGRPTGPGSEHRIDNEEYVAEMQLLFSSKKPTTTSCLYENSGAAMMSVLFREVPGSVADIEPLVQSTRQLRGVWGARAPVQLRLRSLMAPYAQHYYAYSGSLTFPPCTSSIPTLVMAKPASIGEDQVDALRRNMYVSLNYCVYHMAGQLRPTFSAQNRDVYRSFKYFSSRGVSEAQTPPTAVLLALLLLSLTFTTVAPLPTAWSLC